METRFQDVGDEVIELVDELVENVFHSLRAARIKVLFDTKKRTSGGKIVMGRMQKTNDLLRHLSDDEDYILYIDKVTWDNIEKEDRVRLIRHELSHTDVDMDSNTNPYKIRGHELEDFYDEIEYNREDPRWAERCAEVAMSVYERD